MEVTNITPTVAGHVDTEPRHLRNAGRLALATLLAAVLLIGFAPNASASSGGAGQRAGIPSTERIFGWISDLTELGFRRTGTPGGRAASKYVRDRFERFGLDGVRYLKAGSYRWQVDRSSLRVGGVKHGSFPIAHSLMGGTETGSFGTPPGGLTAPLVDVGAGTAGDFAADDVAGKVVLFDLRFVGLSAGLFQAVSDYFYDPEDTTEPSDVFPQPYLTNFTDVVQRAQDAGAVGVVGVLADYFDSNRYYNEYYRRLTMEIPGFWVTRDEGAAIRDQLATESDVKVNLRETGSRRAVTSRSVIGFLPGRSKETILVSSHHDAVFDGAVEDASGTSEVLALARHFSRIPRRERDKSMIFATMDSHFTGYQAHQKFVRKYIEGVPAAERPVVNIALEHIARYGYVKDGRLQMTKLPEVAGILQNVGDEPLEVIKRVIPANHLDRTIVLPAGVFGGEGIPTDASFNYDAGVPVISLISGPIYLYDRQDTVDKVYKPHLRPVARAFAQIIDRLGPMSRDEIAQPDG